jgi:cullin-associated NEDD8-dissociated protein 1
LVTKIHENQVKEIAEKLSELLLTGTPELRDIYTIGLKTIVSDVSLRVGTTVTTHICSLLLSGMSQSTEQAIKSESLDILTDILRRFGHDIATKHEAILDLCMIYLCDPSGLVKKRASTCTAALGLVVSESLLIRLVEDIITRTNQPNKGDDVRTLIQTIGLLSRNVGHRLGRHLNTTVPMFLKYCGRPDDESSQNEASDDLRENCFQGFESFLLRCPTETTPHVESILQATMDFISYDPNYHYTSEDEGYEMSEDEFSDDGGDYSDDDDTSWKVRRAALGALSAIITTRTQELKMICEKCISLLISRFKEREENVRVEVFTVFSQLLLTLEGSHKIGNDHKENYVLLLQPYISSVVTAASLQLGPKSCVASRCAVISMLTRLSSIKGCTLGVYLDEIMPNLFRAAEDRHSDLKLDALEFIRVLVDNQKSDVLKSHVSRIVSLAVDSASDDWYKIVDKAMKLIESLVNVFSLDVFILKPHVFPLYEAVYSRLNSHDIDQEIKESAILTMGRVICVLGTFN